jgi:ADP-ribose pyrophosphatase YjhB (NUDIX family)
MAGRSVMVIRSLSMQHSKIKKQTSSGGILFQHSPEGIRVVLIRRSSRGRTAIWCLPKGWVEPGETLEETALREVEEETGLKGKIMDHLGMISYEFYDKQSRAHIHKTVHFYLMEYVAGDTANHDHEVEESRWFMLDDVEGQLTYPTEKDLFGKALSILKR